MAFKSFFSKKSKLDSDTPDAKLIIDMPPQNTDRHAPTHTITSALSLIAVLISLAAFFVAGMGYLRGLDTDSKDLTAALASQVATQVAAIDNKLAGFDNKLAGLHADYLTLSEEINRLTTLEAAPKSAPEAVLGDDIAALNDRLTILEDSIASLEISLSAIKNTELSPPPETVPPETGANETAPPETGANETAPPEGSWLSRLFGDFTLTPIDNNTAPQAAN